MSESLRQHPARHQCRCLIVYSGDDDVGEMYCATVVESPDAPFCGSCEDRHPDASMMYAPYTIEVTAW